ncbi:MAG TPA: DctP family TRAP transporter solute-binding subunit [Acetobacteraceae bacterium]|nr:DctP family TRAP transporter solute-binding subunit [Acetobacteraceae bacterium]
MLARRELLLAGAAATAGLFASRSTRAADATRTLRIGYLFSKDSQLGAGATAMADEIAKRTSGRIRLQQFPDSTLGGDVEMLKGVQLGSIDLAFVTGAGLPSILPDSDIFHIPFLFNSAAHAHAVFDGPIGQDFLKRISAKDLVALSWGENGMRHMTNSRHPINVPDDLKSLKMRLPQSDVMVLGFKALGADAAMLPFPQLYAALQSGQFDGEENPIATIEAAKFQQVQKFLTLSAHVYDPAIIVMSPDAHDDLSAEDKAIFADAAKLGANASRDYAAAAEKSGVAVLQQAGMQVVTEIDRARFVAAMASAGPEYERRFGRDQVAQIRATS